MYVAVTTTASNRKETGIMQPQQWPTMKMTYKRGDQVKMVKVRSAVILHHVVAEVGGCLLDEDDI